MSETEIGELRTLAPLDLLSQYNYSGVVCSLAMGHALVGRCLQIDYNDAAIISTAEAVMGEYAAMGPQTYFVETGEKPGIWVANVATPDGYRSDKVEIYVAEEALNPYHEVTLAAAVGYEARLSRELRRVGHAAYMAGYRGYGYAVGGAIIGTGMLGGAQKLIENLHQPPMTTWDWVVPLTLFGMSAVAGVFTGQRLKLYEIMAKRTKKRLKEQEVPNIRIMPREIFGG